MEDKGYIYGLKCPIRNEIVYIGQTHNQPNIRLTKHISLTKTKIRQNRTLSKKEHWIKKLINLDREKDIEIIIIEECDLNMIDDREIYWISEYSVNSYMKNLAIGGRVNRGYKQTLETKKRISESRSGKYAGCENHFYNRVWTDDEKLSLSNKLKVYYESNDSTWLGKTLSEETRNRISIGRKGKHSGIEHHNYGKKIGNEPWFKLSEIAKSDKNPNIGKECKEETRKKISEANSGEKNGMYGKTFKMKDEHKKKISDTLKNSQKLKDSRKSEEYRKKLSDHFSVPIYLLDIDFNIIDEFKNLRECSEKLGCTKGNVKNAVNDLRKLCKKYWVVRKSEHDLSIIKIKEKIGIN